MDARRLPGVPPSGAWLASAKQWYGVDEHEPKVAKVLEILRKKENGEITLEEHKEFLQLNGEIISAWEAVHGKLIFAYGRPVTVREFPKLHNEEEMIAWLKGLAKEADEKGVGVRLHVSSSRSANPSAPVILDKPRPRYTAEGRNLGIEGDVVIDVVFLANGSIQIQKIVHGLGHGLDEEAARAAEQIKFKPAQPEGVPCDFPARIRMSFRLSG